jgi:hypothetical protein
MNPMLSVSIPTTVKLFLLEYRLTITVCIIFFIGITQWHTCNVHLNWGEEGCGLFAISFASVFLIPIWFIVSILLAMFGIISGKRFTTQLILLGIIFFVAIPLTDYVMDYIEQRELKDLIEKVETYKNKHSVFPAKLADVGKFYEGKQVFYELNQKTVPTLTYMSTTLCECKYSYDFQEHFLHKQYLD